MRSFITFIYCLTAIMAGFLTIPKTARAGVEETFANNVAKANVLITDALNAKDYDKYSQSRQILKEAEKIASTIRQSDKCAVAYMALAYSYARMRNEYTKSFFDSTKWTSKKQASD